MVQIAKGHFSNKAVRGMRALKMRSTGSLRIKGPSINLLKVLLVTISILWENRAKAHSADFFFRDQAISFLEENKALPGTGSSLPSSGTATLGINYLCKPCSAEFLLPLNPTNTVGRINFEMTFYKRELFRKGHLFATVLWSAANWIPDERKVRKRWQKALWIPIPPLRELDRISPPEITFSKSNRRMSFELNPQHNRLNL